MDVLTASGLAHTLQTVALATIVFAVCTLFPKINYRAQLAKLPVLGDPASEKQRQQYLKAASDMYREGYEKFKNSVFRIGADDGNDNIVIPPRFLPEVRKLPDSVLSFPKAIEKVMEVKYTKILTDQPIVAHTIKADLTPALARLNSVVYAEVEQAMEEEIPECKDWTPVLIYSKLANMVAKISGRIFVGPELCRNDKYLDSAINYTMDLMNARSEVKKVRPLYRPFLAPRLPAVKRLHERQKSAEAFLRPIVQARKDAEASEPNYQKPDDLLQWFMNRSRDFGAESTEMLAKLQLGIIFAAIHTTTLTATNILYNLAVTPEYIQPLREEVRKVMAENGGTITTRALQYMVKLDSYMKEVTRFCPPGATSFQRKVLKGFTLSNGQYIPAGSVIEVPSEAIYHDSANYPDGETFDGFRFYKLRKGGTATDHARNQFVTTNEQNLGFGYGQHACPGRFFAANEIKMLVAKILLNYDIKNEDGSKERYAPIVFGRSSMPDPRKSLLFKKVEF